MKNVGANCKKSCSHSKYIGETVVNVAHSEYDEWNTYYLSYTFNNEDFKTNVYEEYFIYDFMGMIGSVGGTLGIPFILFEVQNIF